MSQKYFTTLTHIGAALHANAQLQQTTVAWTHLVLGDGNGAEPVPNPAQTGVIREVDRLPISSIEPDPDNPSWIVIEAVIPADRGGYVVRETALMGGANGASCIAVGNYPSATKPLLSEGAGSELVIRVVVEIAHTATVTLKIDPAVVIASRDWVQKLEATEEQAKQATILGRWMSPLRALQLLRESATQATELLRGTLRVASNDDMLNKNCDDAAVTPKSLKGGGFWPLGVDQSWVNVRGSRRLGVTYTNTTGRTIFLSVVGISKGEGMPCYIAIEINGVVTAINKTIGGSGQFAYSSITVPIGEGMTYYLSEGAGVDGANISVWMELR